MKFLIFGGTGFIGRHLRRYIEDRGHQVYAASFSGGDDSLAIDITLESEFQKLKLVPDVIINCASRVPASGKMSNDPDFVSDLFMTNVVGGVNIANWAVKNEVKKVINCSTLVVVKKPWPEPLSETMVDLPEGPHVSYSMSKLSQEQIMNECVKNTGTALLHTRLSAVYGPGMVPEGIIFRLARKLKQHGKINLTDARENTVDFIHVQDVCRSLYALARVEVPTGVVNVASGKPLTILQLAEILKEITNSGSVIDNQETIGPASKSSIQVERLKEYIGEVYDEFVPIEEGLKSLIEEEERSEERKKKSLQ